MQSEIIDFIIVGSGFGGSVSALRLAEKGYSVLVVEKGKRFADEDFARSNWQFWKYLWMPALRAHGILQIKILKGLMVLYGAGVGGGSLGYANVLEVPSDETFATDAWNTPIAWGNVLRDHYGTARRMLGVAPNPKLWTADEIMRNQAAVRGMGHTFRTTDVGVYFGESEVTVADPYFEGMGPARAGCRHCGGCMIGCRYNAKNTLPKNYLYFAERAGARILPETEVVDVRQEGTKGYTMTVRSSTRSFSRRRTLRAQNIIFSGGVMGTIPLLLRLKEKSLPNLSDRVGDSVRTNSEALLGSVARHGDIDYSEGIAISSIFNVDEVTRVEPVRYPAGSSLLRFIAAPLVDTDVAVPVRVLRFIGWTLRHPIDFARSLFLPGWAHNVTILLVMQHTDNRMRLRLGRSIHTLFRRGLVSRQEPGYEVPAHIQGSHELTRDFAKRTNGVALGTVGENILNMPTTAHVLGGTPIGHDADSGVVDESLAVHNYPGLYVIDGSVVPANPGVNPALTIAALAEYAMSRIPARDA